MRTRAKQKHVASDRARRENVPRHILFHRKRASERTKQMKKQGPAEQAVIRAAIMSMTMIMGIICARQIWMRTRWRHF